MEFSEGNISGGTSEDKVFEEITPPSNSQGEDTSSKEPSVAETDAADDSSVSYSIEDAVVPAEEDMPYFANEQIHKGDVLAEEVEVLSEMIFGGMSGVWRVRQKGKITALAMKRPRLPESSLRNRKLRQEFADSAELWRSLGQHPNIVSCYEEREICGVPTVFSEWMDGGSLRDKIRDGSLYEEDLRRGQGGAMSDPEQTQKDAGEDPQPSQPGIDEHLKQIQLNILSIALQAAKGLQYAHSNGVVHCDVKPANIMFDADGTAKVNDFGLSRRIAKRSGEADEGQARGYTPQYCAREQLEGQAVKPWMDIYSWALTVLEMYADKRLWQTGDEVRENLADYVSLCRITPPPTMVKLLAGCLKWKINDLALVIKDLEKISYEIENPSSAEEVEKPGDTGEPGVQDGEWLTELSHESSGDNDPESAAENGAVQTAEDTAEPSRKQGFFGKLKKLFSGGKSECRKGNHSWNGCVCSVCGTERHEYELVSEKVTENGGCCWSVSDPCIGPDCGTPCDSYYPGREGSVTQVWRCKHCGQERTEGSM